MNLHLYAKNIVKKTISVNDTLAIASAINNADVCPSRVDIGKLAFEYQQEKGNAWKAHEKIEEIKIGNGTQSCAKQSDAAVVDVFIFNWHYK